MLLLNQRLFWCNPLHLRNVFSNIYYRISQVGKDLWGLSSLTSGSTQHHPRVCYLLYSTFTYLKSIIMHLFHSINAKPSLFFSFSFFPVLPISIHLLYLSLFLLRSSGLPVPQPAVLANKRIEGGKRVLQICLVLEAIVYTGMHNRELLFSKHSDCRSPGSLFCWQLSSDSSMAVSTWVKAAALCSTTLTHIGENNHEASVNL